MQAVLLHIEGVVEVVSTKMIKYTKELKTSITSIMYHLKN